MVVVMHINQLMRITFLVFALASFGCKHIASVSDRKQAIDLSDAAKSLMAEQQYREALRELLSAEKLDAESAEIQYLLASVYFFGYQLPDEAAKHVENAIKLSPDGYPEAENLYGVLLLDQGKVQQSIERFERASQNLLYKTPHFAEQNLGDAYTRLGKREDAVAHFRKAIKAQPDMCGAYLPLAQNLRALGRAGEAQASLREFLRICAGERLQKYVPLSMSALVYFELGLTQLDLKNKKMAKETFHNCAERFVDQEGGQKCLLAFRRL
jgi:Tfp pilus assembly protein PilF